MDIRVIYYALNSQFSYQMTLIVSPAKIWIFPITFLCCLAEEQNQEKRFGQRHLLWWLKPLDTFQESFVLTGVLKFFLFLRMLICQAWGFRSDMCQMSNLLETEMIISDVFKDDWWLFNSGWLECQPDPCIWTHISLSTIFVGVKLQSLIIHSSDSMNRHFQSLIFPQGLIQILSFLQTSLCFLQHPLSHCLRTTTFYHMPTFTAKDTKWYILI